MNGLHGYNAFLLGMGLGYFDDRLNSERSDWVQFARVLLPVVLASVICFLVHLSLTKSLSTPAFTFAYNITLTSWLAYAVSLGRDSFVVPSFNSESSTPINSDPILYNEIDFGWFAKSTLAGIGQVFFAPELSSSIIITGGLAIGSPIAALLGIFGSAIGNTIAILSEGSKTDAEMGIYGLSAVLCAIALGGFYFVFSFRSVLLSLFGSVFCVGMTSVFSGLLVRPIGPSMTFPFCTVATFLYLAGLHVPGLIHVPTHILESPERHLAHHLEEKIEG
jgi:urea transporter